MKNILIWIPNELTHFDVDLCDGMFISFMMINDVFLIYSILSLSYKYFSSLPCESKQYICYLWPLHTLQTNMNILSVGLVSLCLYHIPILGSSWSLSYGSWIYSYLCNQCLSPRTSWVQTPLRQHVLITTLCDKVCLWLAVCLLFYTGTPVSSTNKTDGHKITDMLLKVALNKKTKQNKTKTDEY